MTQTLVALLFLLATVVALSWRTTWRTAALLGSLAVLASASLVSLVDAPPYAVYQHLRLWSPWAQERPVAVVGVSLQAAVCLVFWPKWRRLFAALVLGNGAVRGLVLLGLLLFAAAVPTRQIGASIAESIAALAAMVFAIGNLILVAAAVPESARVGLDRWLRERFTLPGDATSVPRRWDAAVPLLGGVWACVIGAVIGVLVFEAVPHIDDSVSYLFQAKYFSTGRLFLPAPPDSAAFHVDQVVIDHGRWFAYGFPGWPALLALGVRAGASWLVNPILAGVSVVLAHQLVRRTHDLGTANATALLLAASPWFLFMSGELLGHQAAGMWMLLALLGIQLERERRSGAGAAMAGLALGMLCVTRPLDGVIAGLVLAGWALGLGGARRLPVRAFVAGAVAVAIVGLAALAYNAAVTGSALTTAHQVWMDRAWGPGTDRLGFGPDVGNRAWPNIDPLPGHGVVDVVLNFNKNLFQTNIDLFGWGCGSLVFALFFLLSRRREPRDWYAVAIALAFPLGYSAYWFSGGPDHGARYWYLVLVPLVVLTVRGLQAAAANADVQSGRGLGTAAALSSLLALTVFVPWRATTKYHRFRDVSREPARVAAAHGVRDALVFVRSPLREDYQSAFSLNPSKLDGRGNVFARYLDPGSRARVADAFSDRAVWVFARDSAVAAPWVVTGPYPPRTPPP